MKDAQYVALSVSMCCSPREPLPPSVRLHCLTRPANVCTVFVPRARPCLARHVPGVLLNADAKLKLSE